MHRDDRTTLHDLKDIVMIYGAPDVKAEWDDAKITVWNPEEQKEYQLIFCGSTRPKDGHTILDDEGYGEINFILKEVENE